LFKQRVGEEKSFFGTKKGRGRSWETDGSSIREKAGVGKKSQPSNKTTARVFNQ